MLCGGYKGHARFLSSGLWEAMPFPKHPCMFLTARMILKTLMIPKRTVRKKAKRSNCCINLKEKNYKMSSPLSCPVWNKVKVQINERNE